MPLDGPARPVSKAMQLRRLFDYDEAKRRYLDGETTVALAEEYGVSSTAVAQALKRMGVRRIPHWERPEPNIPAGFTKIVERRRNATHCTRGHEYTPENTYINPRGARECRRCCCDNQNRKRAEERARGITREKWGLSRKPEPICRNCPSPARELHHAIPRGKAPHARADLRNGLPLCIPCHDGWHRHKVVIHRDVFRPEEWEFLCSVKLTGERIEAWLDRHYPPREGTGNTARV